MFNSSHYFSASDYSVMVTILVLMLITVISGYVVKHILNKRKIKVNNRNRKNKLKAAGLDAPFMYK